MDIGRNPSSRKPVERFVAEAPRSRGSPKKDEFRPSLDLTYEGLCVPNAYKMDLVVEDKVVVEAKAIEKFSDASFAQLNTYLTLSGLEVGLLLNFHNWPPRDGGIRRVVNTRT